MPKSGKSSLLDKTDHILKNLDNLENILHTQEKRSANKVEKLPTKEKNELNAKEKAEKEYTKKVNDKDPEQSPYVIKSAKTSAQDDKKSVKSKTFQEVEGILAKDLDDIYNNLDDNKKRQFKEKGEEITAAITSMVTGLHASAKKIVKLIKEWLKIIPGINKFFLEQESKIKTQEVILFARNYKREKNKNKW